MSGTVMNPIPDTILAEIAEIGKRLAEIAAEVGASVSVAGVWHAGKVWPRVTIHRDPVRDLQWDTAEGLTHAEETVVDVKFSYIRPTTKANAADPGGAL